MFQPKWETLCQRVATNEDLEALWVTYDANHDGRLSSTELMHMKVAIYKAVKEKLRIAAVHAVEDNRFDVSQERTALLDMAKAHFAMGESAIDAQIARVEDCPEDFLQASVFLS